MSKMADSFLAFLSSRATSAAFPWTTDAKFAMTVSSFRSSSSRSLRSSGVAARTTPMVESELLTGATISPFTSMRCISRRRLRSSPGRPSEMTIPSPEVRTGRTTRRYISSRSFSYAFPLGMPAIDRICGYSSPGTESSSAQRSTRRIDAEAEVMRSKLRWTSSPGLLSAWEISYSPDVRAAANETSLVSPRDFRSPRSASRRIFQTLIRPPGAFGPSP